MSSLKELRAGLSPESLARVDVRAQQIRREVTLQRLREMLEVSQIDLAEMIGVKQPAIAKVEKIGNDPKLSTIKRYIAGFDGELTLSVSLPNGQKVDLEV
ncbi:helix-turn-helix domain-containing protein [Rosenbergiella metrosideri]|uniref:helix-turn-helix domain-containing protein n=1 Tax=Rosenbergiella metrosideri TaxID=2921185 RepID=UPI001F4F2C1A|nr:helix-turn-helix domain-containing protein [Rosenbergiella metrosideri]